MIFQLNGNLQYKLSLNIFCVETLWISMAFPNMASRARCSVEAGRAGRVGVCVCLWGVPNETDIVEEWDQHYIDQYHNQPLVTTHPKFHWLIRASPRIEAGFVASKGDHGHVEARASIGFLENLVVFGNCWNHRYVSSQPCRCQKTPPKWMHLRKKRVSSRWLKRSPCFNGSWRTC